MIELNESLQRQLARNGLLLPLLRSQVVGNTVGEVELTPEEENVALQSWCQRQGISSEEGLHQFCRSQAMTLEDARWQATLPVKVERYSLEHFSHRAEQRFLQRKNSLDRVVYSLLRVRDGGLAQELYLRISEAEATFADLASEHSEGHEKASRGIIGPVPLNQAHPRLVELLRSGSPGQLFPPLMIDSWWLVVRLEDLQPAVFNDAMKSLMSRELFDQWLEEEIGQQIQTYQPT